MIHIQTQDFILQDEYNALVSQGETGAIVTFVGRVRDFGQQGTGNNPDNAEGGFYLDHYPGMTESVLNDIEYTARQRWTVQDIKIIHRVGRLNLGDQIVFVGVSAAHRKPAFAACEYIIDILKTTATFWKKEGAAWVDINQTDIQSAEKWLKDTPKQE